MGLTAIATIGSAVIGAASASKAAKAQSKAADGQLQLGREQLQQAADFRAQDIERADKALAQTQDIVGKTSDRQREITWDTFNRQHDVADNYKRNALRVGGDAYTRQMQNADRLVVRQTGIANAAKAEQNALAAQGFDRASGIAGGTRDAQVAEFRPYADAGAAAQGAYAYELGIGDRPEDYRGFEASPGYEFARAEGLRGIEGGAAARGGLLSGATMRDAMGYATGLAQQDYGNHLARLSGQIGTGMTSAGAIASAQGAYGNAMGRANEMDVAQRTAASDAAAARLAAAQGSAAGLRDGASRDLAASQTDAYGQKAAMVYGAAGQRGADLFNAIGTKGANQGNALATWATMSANANQAAANSSANAYQFQANALANRGDAAAAGAIGVGNALSGGIENALGAWQFKQMLGQQFPQQTPAPTVSAWTPQSSWGG